MRETKVKNLIVTGGGGSGGQEEEEEEEEEEDEEESPRVHGVTTTKGQNIFGSSTLIATGGFGYDSDLGKKKSLMWQYRSDLVQNKIPTTLGPWTTGDGLRMVK